MVVIPIILAVIINATSWVIRSYKSGTIDITDVIVNVAVMVILVLIIKDLWKYVSKKENEDLK